MPRPSSEAKEPTIPTPSTHPRSRTLFVAGTLALLSTASAGAWAATPDEPTADTTIAVGPHTILSPPAKSPFDAHGIRGAIRRGRPIPAGYKVVGRLVTVTRGTDDASALMDLTCPRGTTHRGVETAAGPPLQIIHSVVASTYTDADRRRVTVSIRSGLDRGQTASATVYLVCRR